MSERKTAKRRLIQLQNAMGKKLGKQTWLQSRAAKEKRPERWGFK